MNMRAASAFTPRSRAPILLGCQAGVRSAVGSLSIEEASATQLITFGANALNSIGQHPIDEHVRFAFVIEIDVVDSKVLSDVHVSKGCCYSSFTGNLTAPSPSELVVHR